MRGWQSSVVQGAYISPRSFSLRRSRSSTNCFLMAKCRQARWSGDWIRGGTSTVSGWKESRSQVYVLTR